MQGILSAFTHYHPNADASLIRKAHAFAVERHKNQTRASGEPYITHLKEVALLAANLQMDIESVVTALLHDTVEDTDTTLEEIQGLFGKDVADLVNGVTKLNRVKFRSNEEAQAENFRKMLLAMSKDIRVLMLKLCDRTHNMRTLEFLSESRRERIAKETLEIYAPLASRLGVYWMKSELEDLCLRHLHPKAYENIKQKVAVSKKERSAYINKVVKLIESELKHNKIEGEVAGRPKHFYSIYQKMERSKIDFDEIYDLIAFRVLVNSSTDCYAALGVVHSAWKPVPGRFKDYIAMPKLNGYQSLHTTVIGPKAHRIEIQFRTYDMHEVAEKGVAAHWAYKETDKKCGKKKDRLELEWLNSLIQSEKDIKDPHEFISSVKDDLFSEEVFVFSPRGDLHALPRNATPIDFAFAIHTDIGTKCTGSRVNGQITPLSYKLRNGDTVEIMTSENQTPSKDWLNNVVTTKAKQRIRAHIRSEERIRSTEIGKDLISKDLRKIKKSLNVLQKDGTMQEVAKSLGLKDYTSLYAEVGYGKLSSHQVLSKVAPDESNLEEKLGKEEGVLQRIFHRAAKAIKDNSGVKVHGMDDVVLKFAKCCQPLPGDPLLGFVSRGRGVIVHSRGCSQAMSFDPNRLVDVQWDEAVKTYRSIHLKVQCLDKIGVLANITQTFSTVGTNITKAQINELPNKQSLCSFMVSLENSLQLRSLIRALNKVDGVISVERSSEDIATTV